MKTTVKTESGSRSITVEPMQHANGVHLSLTFKAPDQQGPDGQSVFFTLTPDQTGALIFGLEQALDVSAIRAAA